MSVEHVAVNVADYKRSRRFYDEVLRLFGYRVVYHRLELYAVPLAKDEE